MKIKPDSIVIGERVQVGALILSCCAIVSHFYPENAPAISAAAVPLTFIAQVLVANWRGVTVGKSDG